MWMIEIVFENVFEFMVEFFVEKNIKVWIDGIIGV